MHPSRPAAAAVPPVGVAPAAPLVVLLVEDDEGDALLTSELVADVDPSIHLRREATVADAARALASDRFDCILLDLGLPDSSGLDAIARLREYDGDCAVLVLTGDQNDARGIAAMAAGAQDYLVKGVDGRTLVRAIRYAVERRQADAVRSQLATARIQADEAMRLERGLLPVPILGSDPDLLVGTGYRPGRERTLLGGDFLDVVQTAEGSICGVIGDVCGHGPDEAALGVCLRVAWRTLILGGADHDDLFGVLQHVLVAERHAPGVFATVVFFCVAADRQTVTIRCAGHPSPLLLADGGAQSVELGRPDPPLGVLDDMTWTARTVELPATWGLLLYTDGMVEGRAAPGLRDRLGVEGLLDLLGDQLAGGDVEHPSELLERLIAGVEERHGGRPPDDLAALLLVRGDATQ